MSQAGRLTVDQTGAQGLATGILINEIQYDSDGADTGERVEVAGPAGTDLTGWTLVRYNGSNGQAYATPAALSGLGGALPDQGNGFGTVVVAHEANGLQHGAPRRHRANGCGRWRRGGDGDPACRPAGDAGQGLHPIGGPPRQMVRINPAGCLPPERPRPSAAPRRR